MRAYRAGLVAAAALALSGCVAAGPGAPPDRDAISLPASLPEMARFGAAQPEPPRRPNAQIARDFLDLSFQMESGRQLLTMSRFEGPITVAVAPGAPPTLLADLDALLARLRMEAGIDIRRVSGERASITIETLPRARMQRIVPQAACFVVPRVSSWAEFRRARNSGLIDWTTLDVREQAAVFIPSDVPPQEIRDCLHEEIAQAIGPLNDLYHLPDSVFNDDNFHAVLTGFDMLILQVYYDPALGRGTTREAAAAQLPAILARLNPRGGRGSAGAVPPTPRGWVQRIEAALGRGAPPLIRLRAVEEAVIIAEQRGWRDARLGFSYFALGRLSLGRPDSTAIIAFNRAADIYRRIDADGVQLAHVNMQLAAFALSTGDPQTALDLTGQSLGAAIAGENASLLATLLMIRAEALDDLGRSDEAATVRMDSLRWARYGFGDAAAVAERLSEIASLSP
ncbi:MAG: DUF2927 domain-containing protein [Pseudomonadota bacterium]